MACRARDLGGLQDRDRRLNHRPEFHGLGRARLPHRGRYAVDVAAGGGFRQQDRVGSGRHRGAQVLRAPRRVEAVDANDEFARAVTARLDRIGNLGARLRFGVRGHRVLEIEDQRVGGQRLGFFQRAGVRAGHIKDAASRAHGHRFLRRQWDARVIARVLQPCNGKPCTPMPTIVGISGESWWRSCATIDADSTGAATLHHSAPSLSPAYPGLHCSGRRDARLPASQGLIARITRR